MVHQDLRMAVSLIPLPLLCYPGSSSPRTILYDGLIFLPHQGVVMGAVIVELDVPDDVRRGLLVTHPLDVGNPIGDFLNLRLCSSLGYPCSKMVLGTSSPG